MASLQAKRVHGHTYWQIVESRRVNGRPRPIVLKHLGKADDLLRRLQESESPLEAVVHDFGAVAALWLAAEELQLRELIERHALKRQQGRTVADYILLASIARALRPLPKTRMAAWYKKTVLCRLLPMPMAALTSQRFWDHMGYLDENALDCIEQDLSSRLAKDFGIDLEALFFDVTNFDTFIDSNNSAKLPQRGHAKSKRTDLRIVSLAMMVSADFHIPLFWKMYPGNQPDSVTFSKALPILARRYREWLGGTEQHVTIVFDKGNNSKANMEELDHTPYHIVGSLVPSQHEELLQVPLDRFRRLPERFGKTWAYRTTKQVFSREWTVVVTRSQRLLNGQVRGIRQHLTKKLKCLEELKDKLAKSQGPEAHGKPYTRSSLETHINQIVSGQYIKDILHIRIHSQNGKLSLRHRVDRQSFRRLRQTVLGKRILFTDHGEWTDEQIVDAYRGQHHVERAFRDMKGGELIHFSPSFHWTDSKLLVHGLCCVLGLVLLGLVHRKVVNGAIDISREQLMRELKEVGEVVNLYPPSGSSETRRAGRPRAQRTLTRRTALQKQLCDVLQLDQLASS
jgi:transposase